MAEVKFDIKTNAKQVTHDLQSTSRVMSGMSKNAQMASRSFFSMGSTMLTAFAPIAVGGVVAKGLKTFINDAVEAGERVRGITKAMRELRFVAGKEGIERARQIASSVGAEQTRIAPLLAMSVSGGAGVDKGTQDEIVKQAIQAERGSNITAEDYVKTTLTILNNNPALFRQANGAAGAGNMFATTLKFAKMETTEGRALAPAVSGAVAGGGTIAQGLGVFSALSQGAGTPFEAGTQTKAFFRGVEDFKKEEENLIEFAQRVSEMGKTERVKIVGEAQGSMKALVANAEIFKQVVEESTVGLRGGSIVSSTYKKALEDDPRARILDISERSTAREANITPEITAEAQALIGTKKWENFVDNVKMIGAIALRGEIFNDDRDPSLFDSTIAQGAERVTGRDRDIKQLEGVISKESLKTSMLQQQTSLATQKATANMAKVNGKQL